MNLQTDTDAKYTRAVFFGAALSLFAAAQRRRLCGAEAGRRVKISVQVKISPADFFFLSPPLLLLPLSLAGQRRHETAGRLSRLCCNADNGASFNAKEKRLKKEAGKSESVKAEPSNML